MSFAKCSGDESHSCFVVINDLLYGMTAHGGDNDQGVIFSFNPATPTPTPTATPGCTPANYQALYAFLCSPPEGAEPLGRLTLDPDGTTLYGMTREGGSMGYGVVFKVDTSGNHYTVLHNFMGGHDDGATSDHGYVVQSGHHLYGMTTNGGHHNDGVIFKLNIIDQSFHVLHRFGETNNDGKNPCGSLLLVATAGGDKLYGTTQTGGDNDLGTVL